MDPTLQALRERAKTGTPLQRRAYLINGLVFARMTIQNRTEIAERGFQYWLRTGVVPKALNLYATVELSVASAQSLQVADSEEIWQARKTPHLAEQIVQAKVWGIGVPKAHFALACAGFGKGGCIDSRLGNKYAERLATYARRSSDGLGWVWHASKPGWVRYAQACEAIWGRGDHANKQWVEWLHDMSKEGRRTTHGCLLD